MEDTSENYVFVGEKFPPLIFQRFVSWHTLINTLLFQIAFHDENETRIDQRTYEWNLLQPWEIMGKQVTRRGIYIQIYCMPHEGITSCSVPD